MDINKAFPRHELKMQAEINMDRNKGFRKLKSIWISIELAMWMKNRKYTKERRMYVQIWMTMKLNKKMGYHIYNRGIRVILMHSNLKIMHCRQPKNPKKEGIWHTR